MHEYVHACVCVCMQKQTMAVGCKLRLCLLLIFVFPILGFNDTLCTPPYECLTSSQCAQKLTSRDADKVLFRCTDVNKICCPPPSRPHREHEGTSHQHEASPYGASVIPEVEVPHQGNPPSHGIQSVGITPGTSPSHGTSTQPVKVNHHHYNSTTHALNTKKPTSGVTVPMATKTGNMGQSCTTCDIANNRGTTSPPRSATEGVPLNRLRSHRNFHLLPEKCGVSDIPNRITEGEEADLGEFPWMALVGLRDRFGNVRWFCGGTLINHRYVLTAAHCIFRQNGTVPMVRLGEHNLENATDCDEINNYCLDPPQDFEIGEIVLHEHWNSTTIKDDIALFRLPRDVSESFSVSPICLPFDMPKTNATEDLKYEVAGWGKTDWNAQPGSSVLRKAMLSAVTNQECNLCKSKKKERYCPITRGQICAQGWKSVDVCKGDSGGPLMNSLQKFYQVGITSFKASEHCGADNIPSIFTRVESYLEWILDNIRE